ELVPVQGRSGALTTAFHQRLIKLSPQTTLDAYNLPLDTPSGVTAVTQGDLYISHYMKFGDTAPLGVPSAYRQLFQWFGSGDSRLVFLMFTDVSGQPIWELDRYYHDGPGPADWSEAKPMAPIPSDWFHLEIFWHPSQGSDGLVWVAVNREHI